MSGAFAHRGSFENLLGQGASAEALEAVSLELHVSAKTPPAFLWHTYDDEAVLLEKNLLFAGALLSAGVPFEFHVSSWMLLCVEWLGIV